MYFLVPVPVQYKFVLSEFIIDREINVMPIVPPGNALSDMILGREENRE